MVGVSLRQKPAGAVEQNAPASLRPVSGTPLWARHDHSPGSPRPASPWDEWTIPPKPAILTDSRQPSANRPNTRRPSPHPPESFRPWRIDFERPEVVEYTAHQPVERQPAPSPDPATVTKRLLLLLGLAYLFLAALASGLAYSTYFATDEDPPEDEPEGTLPPALPPSRDPNAPGLHTRPDGSRYLIMPLPREVADRLRGRAEAIEGGAA